MVDEEIKKQTKQAQDIILAVMAMTEDGDLVRNIAECTLWRAVEASEKQKAIPVEEIKKRADDLKRMIVSVWLIGQDSKRESILNCIECSIRSLMRDLEKNC